MSRGRTGPIFSYRGSINRHQLFRERCANKGQLSNGIGKRFVRSFVRRFRFSRDYFLLRVTPLLPFDAGWKAGCKVVVASGKTRLRQSRRLRKKITFRSHFAKCY